MKKIYTFLLTATLVGLGFMAEPLVAAMSQESQPSTRAGEAITPPYDSDFDNNGIDGWKIIDVNNDESTWTYSSWYGLYCDYSVTNPKDEWLIMPSLYLEEGKLYTITFQMYTNNGKQENIEVKYGLNDTIDAMTEEILELTPLVTSAYSKQDFTESFSPSSTGNYFIGFHAKAEANQGKLYLNYVNVSAGVSGDAPAPVSNLVLTADPTGALKCNVAFTTPDKNTVGGDLKSLTEVEVLRGDVSVKTFTNPAMGAELSFDDTLTDGGKVTYSVIAKNENGASEAVSGTVFVGFDKPKGVTSATLTRTDFEGNATVTWTPVTEDKNGLPFSEGDVKYKLRKIEGFSYGYPVWGNVILEGLTGSSYSGKLVEDGAQEFLQLAVIPYTSGGDGDYATTEKEIIGTPYKHYAESFPNMSKSMAVGFSNEVSLNTPSSSYNPPADGEDNDKGYVVYHLFSGDKGVMTLGLISTELINPTLSFYVYKNEAEIPFPMTVSMKGVDEEDWAAIYGPKVMSEILADNELKTWNKVIIPIPQEKTDKVYQVRIEIENVNSSSVYYAFLDNIVLESVVADDLAVKGISAPSEAGTGQNYQVVATVLNKGTEISGEYSVELYSDGKLTTTKTMPALEPEATAEIVFDVAMSPLAEKAVSHYVKVVYDKDLIADNNTSDTVTVAPGENTLPKVDNLNGEQIDESVALYWTAPDLESMATERMTEGFENGKSGDTSYEGWTFVDVDGQTLSWSQGSYPFEYITSYETKGSFFVLDSEENVWASSDPYGIHGGNKCIFSAKITSFIGTPEDWAISPELSGEAQTISFWAKTASFYSGSYYERRVEVLYSTTTTSLSEFKSIPSFPQKNIPNTWTECTVELPAGAKYFAIRACDSNADPLLIDDVTYTPLDPSSFEILGYNVYRNGEKLNENPIEETTYTDEEAPEGSNKYQVTVVYKDLGESAPEDVLLETTAMASFEVKSGKIYVSDNNIIVNNADGEEVIVSSLNGVVLHNGVGNVVLPVSKGIYLVKTGKKVMKVMVK